MKKSTGSINKIKSDKFLNKEIEKKNEKDQDHLKVLNDNIRKKNAILANRK